MKVAYYIVTPVMMKGDYLSPAGMPGKTTAFENYEAIGLATGKISEKIGFCYTKTPLYQAI